MKFARPLIGIARRDPPTLSFWNLVELYVLASIRRRHEVPLPKVRRALGFVERNLHVKRPLVQQSFLTDGVSLFVERYSALINVSEDGQMALRDLLIDSLHRIESDEHGWAIRLYPWLLQPDEPRAVEINPKRAFGRLVIADTGIPTEIVAERFRAGDSIKHLADDYRVEQGRIEAALRWEHRGAA